MRFSCRCSHVFELPDSEAGGFVQCPKCGILNDVPLLSDLPNLHDDGTYVLDVAPPQEDKKRVEALSYVYRKGSRDADGNSIDLRNSAEEVVAAGVEAEPVRHGIAAVGLRPRYDPETGELIVPLDVKRDERDEAKGRPIPMAKPAIAYADSGTQPRLSWTRALIKLFTPVNLLVMMVVVVVHLFAQASVGFLYGVGIVIISPIMLLVQCAIISHYGNIIDETGPCESDELPRPLRDLRWHEDLWTPFLTMFGGAALCYLPGLLCFFYLAAGRSIFLGAAIAVSTLVAAVTLMKIAAGLASIELNDVRWGEDVGLPLAAIAAGLVATFGCATVLALVEAGSEVTGICATVLGVLGTLAFPAVALTLGTSGSVVNLRPDRILGTIGACGPRYLVSVIALIVAVPAYFWGLGAIPIAIMTIVWGTGSVALSSLGIMKLTALSVVPLLVGVYLMHFFSWEIGLLYRTRHEQFPWLFQRHTPVHSARSAAAIAQAVANRRATLSQPAPAGAPPSVPR